LVFLSSPHGSWWSPMVERAPGYFNSENYYSFESDQDGSIWIYSECCADRLDRDAARELRDMLDEYLDGSENLLYGPEGD